METTIKANMITEEIASKIDDALEDVVAEYVEDLADKNLSENISDNFSDTSFVFGEALEAYGILLDDEAFQNVKNAKEHLIIDLVNAQ